MIAHLLKPGRLQLRLCIYLRDALDAFVEAHRLATGEALQAEHLSMLRLYGGDLTCLGAGWLQLSGEAAA